MGLLQSVIAHAIQEWEIVLPRNPVQGVVRPKVKNTRDRRLRPAKKGMAPNVLGFTLGGFAIFISFGDEKFRQLLAEPDDEDDEDAPTSYVRLCSTFVHFILVQILALLFAIIAKAMYFPWADAPAFFKATLPWMNGAAGFIGYALFIYSLTSALAATMHVFRIASMYESFQKSQAEAENDPR